MAAVVGGTEVAPPTTVDAADWSWYRKLQGGREGCYKGDLQGEERETDLDELCKHVPPSRTRAPEGPDSAFVFATSFASSYVVPPTMNSMTSCGLSRDVNRLSIHGCLHRKRLTSGSWGGWAHWKVCWSLIDSGCSADR